MYIPIWFLILIAILGFFYYKQNTPKSKIKRLEKVIKFTCSRILEPPFEKLLIPETDELVGALRKTEEMYMRLRKHYDDDWNKQLELVNDWYDYCNALSELKSALEIYSAIVENGASERYKESIKWPAIKKEEIEAKFKILLKGFRQEVIVK